MSGDDHVIVDKRTLKAGHFLYKEQEEATNAYLIQQGSVKITKIIDDQKYDIAILKAGDIVGERALLPQTKHSTSAEVAGTGAVVVPISKDMLRGKYEKTDKLIKAVLESLVQRLEHANAQRFEEKTNQ
ncbi:MAG: hypothetical protein DHS20C02_11850 [Micavibrio sp.]|nr:MAG: hypothetical protein DHS20C02_11850 [Micavibrio sp.]